MEYITLRQLLNIMPASDIVKVNVRLEDKCKFINYDPVEVDKLREGDSLLLDYEVTMFYPGSDISIDKTDNDHLKLNKLSYIEILLRKRND